VEELEHAASWWTPRLAPLALLAPLVTSCGASLPLSDGHPGLGRAEGSVVATSLDGSPLELPTPGHVTVIDVWATWCSACVETLPLLEELWHEEHHAGLRVIGVATDDNPGLVADSARRQDIRYPNVVDASGELRGWLKVRDLPTVVVFDRSGRMRWVRRVGRATDIAEARDVALTLERER
jgi:thiol-disulfide isomerase/thioredoxin